MARNIGVKNPLEMFLFAFLITNMIGMYVLLAPCIIFSEDFHMMVIRAVLIEVTFLIICVAVAFGYKYHKEGLKGRPLWLALVAVGGIFMVHGIGHFFVDLYYYSLLPSISYIFIIVGFILLLVSVPYFNRIRALEQWAIQNKALDEWRTTTPGLFDTAQRQATEGTTAFKKGDYEMARALFLEAKVNFQKAYEGAMGLNDGALKSSIEKNLKTCERNLAKAEVGLDKVKVEAMIQEANQKIDMARALGEKGEVFKAWETMNEANNIIENAFQIANRRGFKDGVIKLTEAMGVIREELQSLEKVMVSGVESVELKDRSIRSDISVLKERKGKAKEDRAIKTRSEYDYKEGFVRLFISVVNLQDSIITDTTIRLFYDINFLRIDHVNPSDLELCGRDVALGTIAPGEKKTVEYFLDPMVCQTVNVDGEITYKDAKGRYQTTFMQQQVVGIQCPIFASVQTINTATAINLATKVLKRKDTKVFLIPPKVGPKDTFQIGKEIIQKRDIKHVSDIEYKKEFGAMAYYYGKTKTDEQFIIRLTVLEATNSIELFVACDSEPMLTGELAKLGQELNDRLMKERIIRQPIQQVNISIRDSVLQRSKLIFDDGLATKNVEIKDSIVIRSDIGGDQDELIED
jgi:hypothetical protein